MSELNTKQIIEALLMASDAPLTVERMHKILNSNNNSLEISEIHDLIKELSEDYDDCGIELKEVASGWRFQIKPDLSDWIGKLYEERPPKYSYALLETLALIAYRQPITRAEIENVRGVAVSSNIIRTLLDHEWVRIVGHKETPGRPALFATTKKFLDHFNLKTLDELPPLIEFTETIKAEAAEDGLELEVEEIDKIQLVKADDQDDELAEDSEDLFDPYKDFVESETVEETEVEITSEVELATDEAAE